jgi:ribonuclease BN (tRNA processing enzyme)
VRLTVVGSASAWTRRPGHASSCYLIEDGEDAIVLDLGQGAFSELSRYRVPATLDAVLASHLHPDHFVDLVPLRHYLKYEAEQTGRLEIHGPAELAGRLDGLFAEQGFLSALRVAALQPGTRQVARFTVEARHVTHIPDSYAFRVSTNEGPALVYSGDCGVANDLLPLIQPGDVVLCEAAYGAGPAHDPIHLNAAAAATVAARAGASRLLLTHMHDRADHAAAVDVASEIFGAQVAVAEPGLQIEMG